MLKALVWKEWRQLRTLRWGGIGIGLLTPPLLLALAEAANRGWLLGAGTQTTAATVVQDLMPLALGLAFWPLLTMMIVAQACAGDRAAGTESFLLQRPVPRRTVWGVRLAVAFGNVAVLVVSHSLVWWVALMALGDARSFDRSEALTRLYGAGAIACLVAFVAAAAATIYARTPLQAVMIGALLGAIPIVVAMTLTGNLYRGYRIQDEPIGLAVPLLALAGYLIGSYLAACRGEPAGRGRIKRGSIAVAVGVVAMPLFVAASAPIVMRWDAKLSLGNTSVIAAAGGGAFVALNNWQRSGWLVDSEAGEAVRFFPPPVFDARWDAAGERLALLHGAGGSGRMLADPRIAILDRAGEPLREEIRCDECRSWWGTGLKWSGDSVICAARVPGGAGLVIVDVVSGAKRTVLVPGPEVSWSLIEAEGSGELYVTRPQRRPGDEEQSQLLQRLDVKQGVLEPPIEVPEFGSRYYWQSSLSPSGRLWLRRGERKDEPFLLFDLETGGSETISGTHPVWLADDRLVWVERPDQESSRLMMGGPNEARPIRQLRRGWLQLSLSPDRSKLLITTRTGNENFERAIYDLEADAWRDLTLPDDRWAAGAMQWAGPDRLVLAEPRLLGLIDPDRATEVVSVIGRSR